MDGSDIVVEGPRCSLRSRKDFMLIHQHVLAKCSSSCCCALDCEYSAKMFALELFKKQRKLVQSVNQAASGAIQLHFSRGLAALLFHCGYPFTFTNVIIKDFLILKEQKTLPSSVPYYPQVQEVTPTK
ncbi:hypothetical protein HAX54_015030 [Datura stramonium]|uniref:Uncharacterized protein n=1 Tax=Datura stramonium TaxID=4076 RepID=A0ABS8RZV9_DATST|nr:hypothetical protein [Datura stramonium]